MSTLKCGRGKNTFPKLTKRAKIWKCAIYVVKHSKFNNIIVLLRTKNILFNVGNIPLQMDHFIPFTASEVHISKRSYELWMPLVLWYRSLDEMSWNLSMMEKWRKQLPQNVKEKWIALHCHHHFAFENQQSWWTQQIC